MREVRAGEVPWDGGTALQDDPDRPVFHGVGPDDYVCVRCGNLLAESMSDEAMTVKVRVKCGVCKTINVSATDVVTGRILRRAKQTMVGDDIPKFGDGTYHAIVHPDSAMVEGRRTRRRVRPRLGGGQGSGWWCAAE